MPVLALLVVFVVVPITELYVIWKVGGAIGVVPTLLLLAADSILGAMLLRSQGRVAWVRFREAMAAGRLPHREVLDGVLVIFGGAFLITPGFITDVVGLLFLVPPTRAVARRAIAGTAMRGLFMWTAARPAGPRGGADVEGTVVGHEPPPDEPPDRPRLRP